MKSLFATPLALSFALMTGAASAAPVTLDFNQVDPFGYSADLFTAAPTAFHDSQAFSLGTVTQLSGGLLTFNVDVPGQFPYLDVQAAYFLSSTGQRIDLTEVLGVDWLSGQVGVEQWSLAPAQLAAGDWTFVVDGLGLSDKSGSGYSAHFTGQGADLPEPTAPALLAVALVGAGLARRRSR